MIHILLGPDDYSKKQYIAALVKDTGADLVVCHVDDEMPDASRLTETDLFSKAKIFVLPSFPPFDGEGKLAPYRMVLGGGVNFIDKLIASPNDIIISINSLDKRKKENKDLLAHKGIKIKEFVLPHGLELNKWIENRVKELGGQISKSAVDELAVRLGRDDTQEIKVAGKVISAEEVYTLWQAESEIRKLMSYAGGRPFDTAQGRQIEQEDVKVLVLENLEVDAFEIINAIGEGKKREALRLMQEFLKSDTVSDEKGAVIQLNGLLSDQMRSLAITQDFIKSNISDVEIAARTGWKSGRIYIMKKIARLLNAQKIMQILPKLEALDEELKTSQTPPRVLVDLIVSQIF